MRYIRDTKDVGLIFCKSIDHQLCGYVDSGYAGDLDKRRCTIRYVFNLSGGPISWSSMLQDIVTLSTTEAKYMTVTEVVKELLWLQGLVGDLGTAQESVNVFCDSQSTIYLAKNQVYHFHTKHINIRYYFLKESNRKCRDIFKEGEYEGQFHNYDDKGGTDGQV